MMDALILLLPMLVLYAALTWEIGRAQERTSNLLAQLLKELRDTQDAVCEIHAEIIDDDDE